MFDIFILLIFYIFLFFLLTFLFVSLSGLVSFTEYLNGIFLALSLDEPVQLTILKVRKSKISLIFSTFVSWIILLIPFPSRFVHWNFHSPPLPSTHLAVQLPTTENSTMRPTRQKRRPTLILDLDETLVHSSDSPPVGDFSLLEVETKKSKKNFYILRRPGLENFLNSLAPHYSLVVFTASVRRYADAVINLIDPDRRIERRFFRSSCIRQEGQFIKDLATVTRDLKRTIIVDNSPLAYSLHEENAVPIETWFDSPDDRELTDLIPFLIAIKNQEDIRTLLRRRKIEPKNEIKQQSSHLPEILQNHACD